MASKMSRSGIGGKNIIVIKNEGDTKRRSIIYSSKNVKSRKNYFAVQAILENFIKFNYRENCGLNLPQSRNTHISDC